ncbi:hypothetical protein AB0945_04220 [Streptomyces sp. NPDC005474]|uniref:hypothetical protein n=1 Tax=Streptomyces sp. NPDC005474 TaxID=3154878 RepID=UPI003454C6CC
MRDGEAEVRIHPLEVAEDNDSTAVSAQGQTRKDRLREIMRQDPMRLWQAGSMAEALGEPAKTESVRVTMDELMRAGELVKHPGSNYQHATGVRSTP